jgi:enoyl-CoA hydratase
VIGVINGFALGGGCELAMACDLLIAADTAKFAQPEVNLGIIPGYGGTQRLPRLVGRNLAKEMVLTGEMITAQRAYEIGLVNRVVPKADLMNAAREAAAKILSKAPIAVRTAKMAMNRGLDLDLSNACAMEASVFAVGFSTEDRVEGMAAFLAKRKAVFTGR